MKRSRRKIRVGILGCGAIGCGLAKSISKELKGLCTLTAVYDIDPAKARKLEKACSRKGLSQATFKDLLNKCDLIVEAVNAPNIRSAVRQALNAKRNVLAMSTGKLLDSKDLFRLASKNDCKLLIPSGAIAGIDAVKAASLSKISSITLTTRKPPKGLAGNTYLHKKGIHLPKIRKETVIFTGSVKQAIRRFPQNINVAATLALASQAASKIRVRIITSPAYKKNSHEIVVISKSGKITARTDNVPSPSNPKTSYLAVLSGIQTLKEFCQGSRVGT